jgi:hypothetical protein
MTPKEKADSIFQQMLKILWHTNAEAILCKECALIAVDEILNTIEYSSQADELSKISYWQQVKNEIENL